MLPVPFPVIPNVRGRLRTSMTLRISRRVLGEANSDMKSGPGTSARAGAVDEFHRSRSASAGAPVAGPRDILLTRTGGFTGGPGEAPGGGDRFACHGRRSATVAGCSR